MLKSFTKRIALILAVIMMIMVFMPATAFAATRNYVALGDSISFGFSDPTFGGYTRMYYFNYLNNLNDGNAYTYANLSTPGDTTSSLLNVISNNSATIRSGNIFTISIGSNNLLGPAIQAIIGLYGLKMTDFHEPNGSDMIFALANKVMADPRPDLTFAQLMTPNNPKAIALNTNWVVGTTLFMMHWPIIMTRLRIRAPFAKVYVNNLYNPLKYSVLTDARFLGLFNTLDGYMKIINNTISQYGGLYRYRVVDIHSPFANETLYTSRETAPVLFNIPAAITIAKTTGFNPTNMDTSNPLSFWPFFFACDPHPTTVGHQIIFQKLVSVSY